MDDIFLSDLISEACSTAAQVLKERIVEENIGLVKSREKEKNSKVAKMIYLEKSLAAEKEEVANISIRDGISNESEMKKFTDGDKGFPRNEDEGQESTDNELFKKEIEKKTKTIREKEIDLALVKKELQRPVTTTKLDGELVLSIEAVGEAVKSHEEFVKIWACEVGFCDSLERKKTANVYVDLDTYLMPVSTHMCHSEKEAKISVQKAIFCQNEHTVILGQPGAGKTTSMKKMCLNILNDKGNCFKFSFPIVINLRKADFFTSGSPIKEEFLRLVPFNVVFTEDQYNEQESAKGTLTSDVAYALLDELNVVLVLEGFDEIQSHKEKEIALKEIRTLTNRLRQSKIVLTCRSGEFNYDMEKSAVYEIAPLNEEQIEQFVYKWVTSCPDKFMMQVKTSPYYDAAIRPLVLAHLCAIFQRIQRIPDKPKTIYKKIVNLLLEEWDEQRSIQRDSSYSQFETDRKFDFLCNMSFKLTLARITGELSSSQLAEAYLGICENFGLPKSEKQSLLVAKELESHTGLFIRCGYDTFEFAHKSIQEFLTAEHLVKLPQLYHLGREIEYFGAELAIATSISSNSSMYFSHIILDVFNRLKLTKSFYDAFISRLLIERPDFNVCDEIVLAAFTLLSVRGNHDVYLVLMKDLLKMNRLSVLGEYYKIETNGTSRRDSSHLDDDYLTLVKTKNHSIHTLKQKLVFDKKRIGDEFWEFESEIIQICSVANCNTNEE